MTDLFFGCQYVSGKVKLPNGALVDKKRFNVIYGGHEFDLGCGHKTRSAWQAFIHHNVHVLQVATRSPWRGSGALVWPLRSKVRVDMS